MTKQNPFPLAVRLSTSTTSLLTETQELQRDQAQNTRQAPKTTPVKIAYYSTEMREVLI